VKNGDAIFAVMYASTEKMGEMLKNISIVVVVFLLTAIIIVVSNFLIPILISAFIVFGLIEAYKIMGKG